MCDILRFSSAREWVLSEEKSAGGIGTLSEKTLHKMSVASEKVLENSEKLASFADGAISHLNEVGTQLNLQTDNLNQILTENTLIFNKIF